MAERKIKAREKIKEYSLEEFNSDFDGLSSVAKSDVLLKFYITQIHNKLKTEISQDQFDFGNVDGKDDLGIDFIHKDDNLVTIIQAKYRGARVDTEEQESIINFKNVINRLIENKQKPNKRLKEILSEIDFKNDEFNLIFLTTAPIIGKAKNEADTAPNYSSDFPDIGERVSYEWIDDERLNDELRNSLSISTGISEDVVEIYAYDSGINGRQIMTVDVDNRKQCILAVESTQIVQIHQRFRDGLFNLNIRNFIGNTKQNVSIGNTIKDEPNNFYYFNNGISCLAKSIKVDNVSGKITVKGLQVINGAQSVKSLVLAHKKNNVTKNPVILVRVTEIGDNYSSERNFIERITKFNNSQNIVKISDFRSNDSIQLDLQNRFQKINLPNTTKSVLYLRKRTDEVKRTHEVIKFEEFCKALHAFTIDPYSFSSSTSYLFDDSAKGGYIKIFGDGVNVYDAFSQEQFEQKAAIWWLVKNFSDRIELDKKNENDLSIKNALQARWMIISASRYILERNFGDPFKQIAKHYKSGWILGNGKIGEWYLNLYKLSKDSVVYLYTNDKSESDGFLHRNWLRSKNTADKIKNYCLKAPMPNLSDSPSKD
jgi:hypothetical protein